MEQVVGFGASPNRQLSSHVPLMLLSGEACWPSPTFADLRWVFPCFIWAFAEMAASGKVCTGSQQKIDWLQEARMTADTPDLEFEVSR